MDVESGGAAAEGERGGRAKLIQSFVAINVVHGTISYLFVHCK